jgi:hypothetical protein
LYKAMEALVASNHAVNPVIPTSQLLLSSSSAADQTSPVNTATAATAAAVESNGGANVKANGNGTNGHSKASERRHSLSDCREDSIHQFREYFFTFFVAQISVICQICERRFLPKGLSTRAILR